MPDPTTTTDDWEGEPTKEEMLSAPTAAVLVQLRRMAQTIERQGEAIDRLSIAVAQQTAALEKLTQLLTDPKRGRDR